MAEQATMASLPPASAQGSSSPPPTLPLPPSTSTSVPAQSQEEGVLRDVLEELDRERSKRAELEAQIRVLTEKLEEEKFKNATALTPQKGESRSCQSAGSNSPTSSSYQQPVTQRQLLTMEVQVQGYQQLVDALTAGKPAIAAAHKSLIPLHVLRLLEVVPWEAHEHIFGAEALFEWHVFSDKHWQSQLKYFPFSSTLPIVRPNYLQEQQQQQQQQQVRKNQQPKDRSLLVFLAGAGADWNSNSNVPAPHLHGTLTDETLTCIYNIEGGYPLPENQGTWEWIGGWRVVRTRCTRTPDLEHYSTNLDCDQDGWSYASDPQHFTLAPQLVWDTPDDSVNNNDDNFINDNSDNSGNLQGAPKRRFRRRKWIRRRMMVDYPYACERSKQYLKLLAENARLTVIVDKVSEQLVETKTRLTETEAQLMKVKSDLIVKDTILLGSNSKSTVPVSAGAEGGNVLHELLYKSDQVKHVSSKISQWVHSTRFSTDDSPALEGSGGEQAAMANGESSGELGDSLHTRFDWKMIGRSTLLDRISKVQGTPLVKLSPPSKSTLMKNNETSIPQE